MEYKAYENPESKDYDINSSLNEQVTNLINNDIYVEQLISLVGILEDIDEDLLQQQYGISMHEYMHPTKETIAKVINKIETEKNIQHR